MVNGVSAFPPSCSASEQRISFISLVVFATMQPKRLPDTYGSGQKMMQCVGMGMGPWFITMGPGPDPGLWSWNTAAPADDSWGISGVGHLVYMSGFDLPSGQQLLECSIHPDGLVIHPSLPKALIPLTPCPLPPTPECQALRAETA